MWALVENGSIPLMYSSQSSNTRLTNVSYPFRMPVTVSRLQNELSWEVNNESMHVYMVDNLLQTFSSSREFNSDGFVQMSVQIQDVFFFRCLHNLELNKIHIYHFVLFLWGREWFSNPCPYQSSPRGNYINLNIHYCNTWIVCNINILYEMVNQV